jgi:hypothetical protein
MVDILRQRLTRSDSGSPEQTAADVLRIGDLVFIRADEEFEVLRVSRPHQVPRCLVFGNLLQKSEDELYVYESVSQEETRVQFQKLLKCKAALLIVEQKARSLICL